MTITLASVVRHLIIAASFISFPFQVTSAGNTDTAIIIQYLKKATYYQQSNPDTALRLAYKAYQAALQSRNPMLLVASYTTFADIYYYLGNQQLTLDYYFKAQRQLEENTEDKESPGYLKTIARNYCNIGNCYYDLKMKEMALIYYEKSMSLIDNTKRSKPGVFTPTDKMLLLYNIGDIFSERKEYGQARKYYLMAQEINKSINNDFIKAGLLEGLGIVSVKEGQVEEPLKFLNEALEIRLNINDLHGVLDTYLALGDYYLARNDLVKTKEWYLKAMSSGKQSSRWQVVQIAADHLTQIYHDAGNYKKAYEMKNLSAQLNDSIFNNQSTTKLTRLALQYEYDRQIKFQELKQQKEIDRQKNRKTFFILLSTIFLLLIIMIVLLLVNQRRKLINSQLRQKQLDLESKNILLEKEKLKNELVYKNKELTTNVMYLVQKNEFITDIAQRAKEIIAGQPESVKQSFSNLAADLQRNTDNNVWKEFEVRFQEVHQDFYRRLNERFPNLSPNEKKLAAFLRLNMSSKDISSITFQSPESIKIARSRLRKKMELPPDENLITFLEKI